MSLFLNLFFSLSPLIFSLPLFFSSSLSLFLSFTLFRSIFFSSYPYHALFGSFNSFQAASSSIVNALHCILAPPPFSAFFYLATEFPVTRVWSNCLSVQPRKIKTSIKLDLFADIRMSDRPKTAFSIADLCSSDTESDGIEEQIGERVAGSSSSLVNAASIPKTPRSSPVTDENLLQNAAPGYPEGVSQLTSPLFSNAVYMGIITRVFSILSFGGVKGFVWDIGTSS